MNKKQSRLRRARKIRANIRNQAIERLCIFRTPRHVYAQVIDVSGSKVIASASTLDKDVKSQVKYSGNAEAASVVGKLVAERAKAAGVNRVAFDRSGFQYHGRVKALAEAARENGMEF